MKLTRRTWMQAAGIGAATAAAGGTMVLSGSRARAGLEIPKRIVFFYIQSGSMPGRWEPILRAGASASTETEWDVNPDLHGDLAPYRADLNYFENLDFLSEYDDPTDPANSHVQGGTHAMCAAHRISDRQAGGITIDQLIAQRINSPSPVTPLPSIELACPDSSSESTVSATGPGAGLPRMGDPRAVYDRLFPDTGGGDPDRARAALRRSRIFELVRGRYDALAPRLSGDERAKLEQHRDTVVDLERRLALADGRTAEPPDPSILAPLDTYDRTDDTERYRTITDLNIRLGVAALHADVTRVASFEVSDAPNGEIGYTPGQLGTTDSHDLIHKVMDIGMREPLSMDDTAIQIIRRQHLAGTRWMRFLLDELAGRTEVDGSRLLDHTVVVFTSQIADGSHCLQRLPWYTVGSCGGAIRTGRYFRSERRADVSPLRWISPRWDGAGRGHSDLFVTLARAMGVDIDVFGAPSANTGPIPGMLA
jgi:hypothetical protein